MCIFAFLNLQREFWVAQYILSTEIHIMDGSVTKLIEFLIQSAGIEE